MGAELINHGNNSKKEKVLTYQEKKALYQSDHEHFRKHLLSSDLLDEINSTTQERLNEAELQKFMKKHDSKIKKAKIKNFKELAVQLITENYLNQKFLTKELDVFETAKQVYSKIKFTEDEITKLKDVVLRFEKEFEVKMKFVMYDMHSEIKTFLDIQHHGIIANMKFNETYSPNILAVTLSHQFFQKKQVALDLAEFIENCSKLQIVIFIIYPLDMNNQVMESFGLDGNEFQILYKLFKGVSNNKNIKGFFFHSVKDYKLIIPPEISTLLIKKLQSETLVIFHLGNITLSLDFVKKFFFQIVSTRSMLLLSLEGPHMSKIITGYLGDVVKKNNSLVAVSLVGDDIEESKEKLNEIKKNLYSDVTPINVVYFGTHSIFVYPPKKSKRKAD